MTDRKYKADAKNYTAPKRTHTAAAPEVITRHFDSITQAHTKYTRTQVYLFPIIFLRFGFFFLYKANAWICDCALTLVSSLDVSRVLCTQFCGLILPGCVYLYVVYMYMRRKTYM